MAGVSGDMVSESRFRILRTANIEFSRPKLENIDDRNAPRQAGRHSTRILEQRHTYSITNVSDHEQAECNQGRRMAPTSPEWRSGILLLNDGREKGCGNRPDRVDRAERAARAFRMNTRAAYTTKRTNTAALFRHEVEERTRRNHFTADLSVFQAHLPRYN